MASRWNAISGEHRCAANAANAQKAVICPFGEHGGETIEIHFESFPDLYYGCLHRESDEFSLNKLDILLCVEASSLLQMGKDPEWRKLSDLFLRLTCAALNSPVGEDENRRGTWRILIHLRNYNEGIDYIGSFAEKLDDKLFGLLPRKAEYSDIFDNSIIDSGGQHFLQLRILPTQSGLAIKDGRTSLIADRGLMDGSKSDLDTIRYHLFERPEREKPDLPPRPVMLQHCLLGGATYALRESASLQLKRLRVGDTQNVVSRREIREMFRPMRGMDFVVWIWEKSRRSLGEYISAFAKRRTGGSYYCGMREERQQKASQEVVTSYIAEGLRLSTAWRAEIKGGLERRIREEMLWLERDGGAERGFKVITPEINHHFTIDFLPVESRNSSPPAWGSPPSRRNLKASHLGQRHPFHHWREPSSPDQIFLDDDSQTSSSQSYESDGNAPKRSKMASPTGFEETFILEVRVAPFNGIVFHHSQGPEAYTMQKAPDGSYRPVPMSRDRWEETLADLRKTSTSGQCARCPLHCRHA